MPDYNARMRQQRKRLEQETEAARFQTRENLARARQVQGLNDYGQSWDITEAETGRSARIRPWAEIEEMLDAAEDEEAARICIWCGQVSESIEALEQHEDACAPEVR